MTPLLFLLTCVSLAFSPAFTLVVAGLLVHHGVWSIEWALPTLWSGTVLRFFIFERRKGQKRKNSLRPLVLLPYTVALFFLGLVTAHAIHSWPAPLRLTLGLSALGLTFVWLAAPHPRVPAPLLTFATRLPSPEALTPSARGIGAALLVLPFLSAHPTELAAELRYEFEARGLEPDLGALRMTRENPIGLSAIFSAKRILLPARKPGEKTDIFLARVMFDHEGRLARVTGIFNLTQTAAVDENDLKSEGRWATWTVRSGEHIQSIELLDLGGEQFPSGPGWSFVGRLQRRISNLQQTGQFRGVGRSSIAWPEAGPPVTTAIERGVLHMDTDDERISWPLGREPDEKFSEAGLVVRQHVPPRPGNVTTWAVDRLRQVRFIGDHGMQWLKGVVYLALGELEDLHATVVGVNAEENVSAELGDVIERLPLAKVSAIEGFPPAPLVPVLSPPLPSEGEWIDLGRDVLLGGQEPGASSLVFTFIRVDPKRSYNQVSIALWDPRRVELHVVAGTEEPQSTLGRQGTGLIPRDPELLERLLGAFNGAFQAVHGEFGMMEKKVLLLPPKPYAATVATFEDGSAGFGTWPAHSSPIPEGIVSFRQNMTPLVAASSPNPYSRHWWGGVPEGWTQETRTVRSALCLTKDHHIAYLYSPSVDPDRLAQAMLSLRCSYGIHLDMNAGHAGFELYRVARSEALPSLGRALDPAWEASGKVAGVDGYGFLARLLVRKMPLMNFPRYIHETPRDFFYLTRRDVLPGERVALPEETAQREFGPVDTPHNEYPHFAVGASAPEESTKGGAIVRIDPRQLALSGADDTRAVWFPGEPARTSASERDPGSVLILSQGRFSIEAPGNNRELGSDAVVLAHATTRPDVPADLYCVDRAGMLNVLEEAQTPARKVSPELPQALGCVTSALVESRLRLRFEPSKQGTWVTLHRARRPAAREIFPETPIVSPSVWGIPQAKRVQWETGTENKRSAR